MNLKLKIGNGERGTGNDCARELRLVFPVPSSPFPRPGDRAR
jgi:hypothetical protein